MLARIFTFSWGKSTHCHDFTIPNLVVLIMSCSVSALRRQRKEDHRNTVEEGLLGKERFSRRGRGKRR